VVVSPTDLLAIPAVRLVGAREVLSRLLPRSLNALVFDLLARVLSRLVVAERAAAAAAAVVAEVEVDARVFRTEVRRLFADDDVDAGAERRVGAKERTTDWCCCSSDSDLSNCGLSDCKRETRIDALCWGTTLLLIH
jgi:hypothetical protein